MTVLGAEVARSVAVDVLGVDVGTVLNQRLDHAEVASQTCNVQRRTEVVRSGINLRSKFDEDLNQRRVTLAGCQMQRSEAVRIGAIHNFKHLVVLIEILFGKCENFDDLGPIALIDLRPVVHLDLLDVLLSILLLLRLFALA